MKASMEIFKDIERFRRRQSDLTVQYTTTLMCFILQIHYPVDNPLKENGMTLRHKNFILAKKLITLVLFRLLYFDLFSYYLP